MLTNELTKPYNLALEMQTAESSYKHCLDLYIDSRFYQLQGILKLDEDVRPPQLTLNDLGIFAKSIFESLPLYVVEKGADQSDYYSSARGAVYTWINQQMTGISWLDGLNKMRSLAHSSHGFRCTANSMDALADETYQSYNREDLRNLKNQSELVAAFYQSKENYYKAIQARAPRSSLEEKKALGISARRFQMHQDLFFDAATMQRKGIDKSQFFKRMSNPDANFPFDIQQGAILILLGLDAETLHVDASVSTMPAMGHNVKAREAGFWAGVMGTMGDQWADVLQDVIKKSPNMYMTFLDHFPGARDTAEAVIEPFREEGMTLIESPTLANRIKFLQLQFKAHQALRTALPEETNRYGGLIQKSFIQIPEEFRNAFVPMRIASWDIVSLYQLSDFLLHKDLFETLALNRDLLPERSF